MITEHEKKKQLRIERHQLERMSMGGVCCMRVGKANGVKVSGLRMLAGILLMQRAGLRVGGSELIRRGGWSGRIGRWHLDQLLAAGLVRRVPFAGSKPVRKTLEVCGPGLGLVRAYKLEEAAHLRGVFGGVWRAA